jgi:AraC-like DNA-binding protein
VSTHITKPDSENRVCLPGPLLSNYAALLWSHKLPLGAPPRCELSLPEGTVELVLNLADSSDQGMLVCGPHSRPFRAETPEGASLLAVHFHPGGAFPFFALPLAELHNQIIPLETLWGPSACDLRDTLVAAAPDTRFQLLENALRIRWCSHVPTPCPLTAALRLLDQEPTSRVAAIAETIGWSERHLNRVFRERTGLSPKLYCRIRRFQSTLRQIPTNGPAHWAELAQTCGYYDQAHLVHDFHEFSSVTPTVYQTRRNRHWNHLPG